MADMTITKGYIEMSGAQVTFGGTDLGVTEGGITFTYSQTWSIFRPDQTTMAEKPFLTAEDATLVCPLAEYKISNLLVAMSTGTLTGTDAASDGKIEIGGGSHATADLKELIVTPAIGAGTLDTDANHKITIYLAICTESVDIGFNREGARIIQCTFMAFRDSSQTAGKQLFMLGDSTAT